MKKKVLGISVGIALVAILIIGLIVFQKQANEKKKIETAQTELAKIEKDTAKDGVTYKKVASLSDKEEDFLSKEIKLETIQEYKKELQKKQEKIVKIKEVQTSEAKIKAAEKNVQQLQEKLILVNEKLAIQTDVNRFFITGEKAIQGNEVKDQLPISANLTKDRISKVTELVEKNEQFKGKWKEAINSIIKNANSQVEQIDQINKLLNDVFEGNVPKTSVKQSDYDTLSKEIEKVKNNDLKTTFNAKLVLLKAVIDASNQLDALTRQKEAAEQEVAKAVEKAKAQATQQSSEQDKLLAGYSDDQIEYARVWLTMIGVKPTELRVRKESAGSPINPYDVGGATYPAEVTVLYGAISAEGQIVYTSNHNGTINVYPVPSHWQIGAENAKNPEFVRKMTQDILDNVKVVSVDVGNPKDVKSLIELQK
ncbi:hypothetical protein ACWOC1_05760 [Enterococcus quebecensis]|uniref:Uncharacterized protein n=1 Tax=Enterococcus quebecensis TaxID=903983 RepID=A0A1E5GUW6_9ENTE|nr:hypothetical protein [Enterococcus quebecensis]OEG16468.1 hypothetical protein BCR23_06155 [Enterococcus quebecensis]OJG74164.1 hypothetical protein RV12_GL002802 [Enterococcus quebecensis]